MGTVWKLLRLLNEATMSISGLASASYARGAWRLGVASHESEVGRWDIAESSASTIVTTLSSVCPAAAAMTADKETSFVAWRMLISSLLQLQAPSEEYSRIACASQLIPLPSPTATPS